MELKEYQASALQDFGRWREALEKARAEADKAEKSITRVSANVLGEIRNYPKSA